MSSIDSPAGTSMPSIVWPVGRATSPTWKMANRPLTMATWPCMWAWYMPSFGVSAAVNL